MRRVVRGRADRGCVGAGPEIRSVMEYILFVGGKEVRTRVRVCVDFFLTFIPLLLRL